MSEENEIDEQENLGGTTNLSLDQLKADDGATSSTTEATDDLHEIQAGDDLNEPGEDEELNETGADETTEVEDYDSIPSEDIDEENAANPENNT